VVQVEAVQLTVQVAVLHQVARVHQDKEITVALQHHPEAITLLVAAEAVKAR
jgi:hypothetical protein